MTIYDDVKKTISDADTGPHVGAFFDFDGTIISGYSIKTFLREQARRGLVKRSDLLEMVPAMANVALGLEDISEAIASGARIFKGASEESYQEFGEEIFEKYLSRSIFREARALIKSHLDKGHRIVIASSAMLYQVEPAAKSLGIDTILCTRLEVQDGIFTGSLMGSPVFGAEKVNRVEAYAKEHAIDLTKSYFYTDGYEDMELLGRVGHPQVVNPQGAFKDIALRKGWKILNFKNRKAGVAGVLRTVGVYGSVFGSYVLGIAVEKLGNSEDAGRTAARSLSGDLSLAFAELELDVSGEEILWSNRPAVVIGNHQSNIDGVILMKLLRGNAFGIGKKEIADVPILGRVMEYMGTIPVDRKNAASAIESMKPLVDAMIHDKKFVMIAPEGTRSTSTKPGPFKKGAFHIAMQAGVPIVPVVIHNSIDALPKGEFVFRPATVKVDVLEPIDTSDWSRETLDTHIAEVRNLYLKALGYPEEPVPVPRGKKKTRRVSKAKSRPASGKQADNKPKRKPIRKTQAGTRIRAKRQ